MPTAREEILHRIRQAIPPTAPTTYTQIDRHYRQTSTLTQEQKLHLLEDRLRDYDAGVYRCSPADIQPSIEKILTERNKTLIALPAGIPAEWLPPSIQFAEDTRHTHAEIDRCQGVLTTATLAIALTGTIVLQDVEGQGRRAVSLLPDYHLCVVHASTVVETVPEAMALLDRTSTLATTFFSGPSATADIEMTRIKGVHGPRFVDVILVV